MHQDSTHRKFLSRLPLFVVLLAFILLASTACCRCRQSAATQPSIAAKTAQPARRNLSVDEFDRLRAQSDAVVLDVRTPREYQAGHIPGAILLDVNAPDFAEKARHLDPNRTYLVHCASGRRSLRACDQLSELGFPHLYNLTEGFNAWKSAGKPVEP